jgi:hypothetical protein
MTKEEKLKEDIEELRVCLNLFLESCQDIEKLTYGEVSSVWMKIKDAEIQKNFIYDWKEFWEKKAKLKGYEEGIRGNQAKQVWIERGKKEGKAEAERKFEFERKQMINQWEEFYRLKVKAIRKEELFFLNELQTIIVGHQSRGLLPYDWFNYEGKKIIERVKQLQSPQAKPTVNMGSADNI